MTELPHDGPSKNQSRSGAAMHEADRGAPPVATPSEYFVGGLVVLALVIAGALALGGGLF